MGKKLWTVNSNSTDNYCEVHMDMKEEYAYIKFYDIAGAYVKEEFKGKSLGYVSDAAENWAMGIKKVAGIS